MRLVRYFTSESSMLDGVDYVLYIRQEYNPWGWLDNLHWVG